MDSLLHPLLLLVGLLQGVSPGTPGVPGGQEALETQEVSERGVDAQSVPETAQKGPAERHALEPQERAGLLADELDLDLVQRSRVREIVAWHEHGKVFRRKGAAHAAAGQRGRAATGKAKAKKGSKRPSTKKPAGGKRASKEKGKKARGGGKARMGAGPSTVAAKGLPRPGKAAPETVLLAGDEAAAGTSIHESLDGLDARVLTEILAILEKEQVGRYLELLGSQGLAHVRLLASQRRKALAGLGERAGSRRRGGEEDDEGFSLFGEDEGEESGGRGGGKGGGRGKRGGRGGRGGGSGGRPGFF